MKIAYAGFERPVPKPPKPSRTPRRDKLIAAALKWKEEQKRNSKANAEAERLRLKAEHEAALMRARTTPASTIIEMVAFWHGFDVDTLTGKAKWADVMVARFDAIAAVYTNCSVLGRVPSLKEIGRAFGGRDHTTILHALRVRGLR